MRKRYVIAIVLMVAFVAGAVLFLGTSLRHSERNTRLEEEIQALQAEADRIRRENVSMGEKIAYLSSVEFREREAKAKLGLKRKGEEVVALSSAAGDAVRIWPREEFSLEQGRTVEFVKPNYLRWWERFAKGRPH